MWAHTSFIGREDFNGRLVTIVYYKTRTFLMWRKYFMYAQIFWIHANVLWARTFHGREHFMGANISWVQTFHGREHFMGANISWARIFHGSEYFMGANILICASILHVSKYFKMCAYILIGCEYFVCK